jgi:PAS domain S-box-containing protein
MVQQLKNWLFSSLADQKNHQQTLLTMILKGVFVLTLVLQFFDLLISVNNFSYRLGFTLATTVVSFALYILLRRHYFNLANLGFLLISWLLLTTNSFYMGGVSAPSFSLFTILVLWATITLKRRGAIFMNVLCIITGLILVYYTDTGAIAYFNLYRRPLFVFVVQIIVFLTVSIFAGKVTGQLEESFRKADEDLQEIRKTQGELFRFKEMTERARDIITIVDYKTGNILYGNQAALKAYGYPREEFLTLNIHNLQPNHTHASINDQMNQAISDSGVLFETIHKRKDGSCFPVEVNASRFNFSEKQTLISIARDINKRKKTEKELQKEQAFNSAILSNIGSLVIVYDAQAHISFWNQACCLLTGYQAAEVLGHYIWDFLLPDGLAEEVKRDSPGYISQHSARFFENQWITKTGEMRQITWNSNCILDEEGQTAFIIDTGQDVTERRRTQAALQENEALFRSVFEQAAVGIVFTNPQGIITDFNQRLCDMLGYTRQELLGRRVFDLTHPNEHQKIVNGTNKLISQKENNAVWERRYIKKDGSILSTNVAVTMLRDENDNPKLFFTFVEDITDLKHAQEELQLNNRRMKAQLDLHQMHGHRLQSLADFTLQKAVELTDSQLGFIAQVNDDETIMNMLTGINEIQSHMISTDLLLNYPLKQDNLLTKVIHQRHTILDNHVIQPQTGFSPVHLPISKYLTIPILNDDHIVFVVSVANKPSDYTETDIQQLTLLVEDMWLIVKRNQAEEELQTLNAELELHVQERTARLEAANKELEAFTYSVSHDLRAPLRSIGGFTQALQEDFSNVLPEEGRHHLERIEKSINRMNQLIEALLRLSRLSRHSLNIVSIEPAKIIHSAWDELETEKGKRNITLTIADLPSCKADPALIKQVFVNLLSNAIKYSQPVQQTEIYIGWQDLEGETVYWIKDNGVGFDMQYADRLFGVFQRLHSSNQFEGTGVGLAIVQRIISRHGGRIWFKAAPNQGATFYFTLGEPS